MALSLMKFAEALRDELKKNPDLIVGDEFIFRSENPDYIGLPISYQVQKDWGGLYRLHEFYEDYTSGEKTIEQIAAIIAETAKTYKIEKKNNSTTIWSKSKFTPNNKRKWLLFIKP